MSNIDGSSQDSAPSPPHTTQRSSTPIPLSAYDAAHVLANGLMTLFEDSDSLCGRDPGSVYLTKSQYWLVYPTSKEYHEQVGVLDFAFALVGGRDRGLFFQMLSERLIPALQQVRSMPVLLQKQIGLVRLIGKFVGCGSGLNYYRGVLDSVKVESHQSVLFFKRPKKRKITLEMAELTKGRAYCREIKKEDLIEGELCHFPT
jgi:hypothetical protein